MKKYLAMVITLLLVSIVSVPALAITFDISPFENSTNYEIEFDDMDDTGEISLVEGGMFFGLMDDEAEEGLLLNTIDIKITENNPPVIRLTFLYIGEDWIFTDKVIVKPADTRYTFEVRRDTDVSDGKIYEMYTLVMTDESIKMLEDIVNNEVSMVKCRLDGDRKVNCSLMFNLEKLAQLLDDYKASGALENSFVAIKTAYPCSIK